MSDMVPVPAEKIAALREATPNAWGITDLLPSSLWVAARAVVDTVETEDEPLCRCGHDKAAHEYEYSPVKGHCSHGGTNGVPECRCARYTPAHVAAPDELTALREEVNQYVFESIPLIAQQRDTAEAERDALREGLRDVLDNWWGNNPRIRLVALLGDA